MKTTENTTETPASAPASAPATETAPVAKPKRVRKAAPAAKAEKTETPAETGPKGPKLRITGKNGALRIHGLGTIKDFAAALREKDDRPWENPTATAFVNGLVAMGGAKVTGFSAPNPDGKKGRTSKIYNFDAKIGK